MPARWSWILLSSCLMAKRCGLLITIACSPRLVLPLARLTTSQSSRYGLNANGMNELRAQFRQDGVVFIKGALDHKTLKLAEEAFQWTYTHPGPGAGAILLGTPGTIYQDQANPDCFAAYHELLRQTNIPDIAAGLFSSRNVWLLYEQIWFKDGDTRRTPWHQDLPYLPIEGDDLCVMWATLDPVSQETTLEFVRGSHRGPLFNPTAFNPDDESAALFKTDAYP